ncbi:MAG: hypothetical protein IPO63_11375 [Bacteroidetes bacterium]|nr:hypothetical protein [Bacteroidota bacterium]
MKKHILLCFTFLILFSSMSEAQRLRARWKAYRYEWSFGIGASNFLGDLGGANAIGTNGFKDLELSLTRPALTVGMRYKLSPALSIHSHLTYGHVKGDDKLTKEYFRSTRSINFKSNIYEFNVNFEAALLSQKEGGIYRLRGVRRSNTFEGSLYGFIGIGVFHFNPKGEFNDKWYELQPLGTEGQGISPARDKYKRTQICIPFGVGGRYFFNRRWGVGFEFGLRKTFTDYIDDVSKTYYDPAAISQANGPIAEYFSNPNPNQESTAVGQQRGDPRDKDAYMFAIISLHYKIRTGRTNFPIF